MLCWTVSLPKVSASACDRLISPAASAAFASPHKPFRARRRLMVVSLNPGPRGNVVEGRAFMDQFGQRQCSPDSIPAICGSTWLGPGYGADAVL